MVVRVLRQEVVKMMDKESEKRKNGIEVNLLVMIIRVLRQEVV